MNITDFLTAARAMFETWTTDPHLTEHMTQEELQTSFLKVIATEINATGIIIMTEQEQREDRHRHYMYMEGLYMDEDE